MPWFQYTATQEDGSSFTGSVEAPDADTVRLNLREQGVRPVQVVAGHAPARAAWADPAHWCPPRQVHVELCLRQLAVMLRSGLTLLSALETVIEQAPSRPVARVWMAVRDAVESGSGFAQAMDAHRCFGHATVRMVALGEESGNLDTVLDRAASAMERRRLLKQSTLSALAYPAITLLAAIAITAYMVLGVIPQMERFLSALGRRLPAMTQSLLDLSRFIQEWALPLGILLVTIGLASVAFYLWPPGRMVTDRWVLRLPLIGLILRTAATALFARSMAILLQSGIPLLESLRAVQSLHTNRFLSALLDRTRRGILDGAGLAEGLDEPKAYTPMLHKMVAVGEASGTLDEILENVAEFHEQMLQALIKQLSALVEPAIILIVGGIVGYVYIAFFVGLFAASGAR